MYAATVMSSNPTTERSSGTRRPRRGRRGHTGDRHQIVGEDDGGRLLTRRQFEQANRRHRAAGAAEVAVDDESGRQPEALQRGAPRLAPAAGVKELVRAADEGDSLGDRARRDARRRRPRRACRRARRRAPRGDHPAARASPPAGRSRPTSRGADRRRAGRRRARRRRGGRRRVADRPPARRRCSGRPAARATRCGPTVRPRHRRRTPGRTGRRRAARPVERARDPSRRTARWPTTWPRGSGASRARGAASRIRSLVAGATPGRSLRTNDTRPLETPARRATSTIVARRRLVTPRVPLEPTAASGVLAYDVTVILNRFRISVKTPSSDSSLLARSKRSAAVPDRAHRCCLGLSREFRR